MLSQSFPATLMLETLRLSMISLAVILVVVCLFVFKSSILNFSTKVYVVF